MRLDSIPPLPRDIDALEEAFVRCHALEAREPGGGRWPFAGDAPWHLMERSEVGDVGNADVSITLIETESGQQLPVRKVDSRAPRVALDAGEVADLALLRGWLALVPDCAAPLGAGHDRKLVWLATGRLHAGEERVPWKAVGAWIGSPRSADALAMRYRRALAEVVCRLNGWPARRAKRMAA